MSLSDSTRREFLQNVAILTAGMGFRSISKFDPNEEAKGGLRTVICFGRFPETVREKNRTFEREGEFYEYLQRDGHLSDDEVTNLERELVDRHQKAGKLLSLRVVDVEPEDQRAVWLRVGEVYKVESPEEEHNPTWGILHSFGREAKGGISLDDFAANDPTEFEQDRIPPYGSLAIDKELEFVPHPSDVPIDGFKLEYTAPETQEAAKALPPPRKRPQNQGDSVAAHGR